MATSNLGFWLFLATSVVAFLTFMTIVVWSENRRKERQEYYRFEFRKRLVDAGKMDAAAVASLVQYEHDLGLRQGREKVRVAGIVIFGVGAGTCLGLSFLDNAIWMLGLIPLGLGLSMLLYGLLAGRPVAGPPPIGWSAESDERG